MKVFISKELDKDSKLKILNDLGHTIIGESLIEISPIPFVIFEDTDWLFFYSKNGIKHFFNQIDEEQRVNILKKNIGVVGSGTAEALMQKTGKQADFIGTSDMEPTKRNFEKIVENKTVLFIKAKESRSSFEVMIPYNLKFSLAVYQNKIRQNIKLPSFGLLIFTSPLNAEAYYKNYSVDEAQNVISIGPTTTLFLQTKCMVKKVITSTRFDEKAILSEVLKLL